MSLGCSFRAGVVPPPKRGENWFMRSDKFDSLFLEVTDISARQKQARGGKTNRGECLNKASPTLSLGSFSSGKTLNSFKPGSK